MGRRPYVATVFLMLTLAACADSSPEATEAGGGDVAPSAMLGTCVERVATWAGVSESDVTGEDLSHQNPSGAAWDFRGDYPGGGWACGGPSGQAEPSTVMVYPSNGSAQEIVDGGMQADPGDDLESPESVLAALESAATPSAGCLAAMEALANTSYEATEDAQNAAVAATTEACASAGEYIVAFKEYPEAWGMSSATFIDGTAALITIQSACFMSTDAPMCLDAAANGLLN